MRKISYNAFKNNDVIKLVAVIASALLLITVLIILLDDIAFDHRILIYALFGTIAAIGFLYSYSLTKRNARIRLSFGYTRKAIYKNYLKNTLICLLVSIFLAAYYMLIYNLVNNYKFSILDVFDLREVVFLPLVYLLLSFLGFFLGVFKMSRNLFYSLFTFIIAFLVIILIYYTITNLLNYLLLGIAIIFGILNYLLFMRCKL
ncbi:MAG: hypothetical protein PHX62_06820 [Bacilli bacterium]|nr:hypothetical protein [Bacilli bacterium]